MPKVWNEGFSGVINSTLANEAARLFRIHQLPADAEGWRVLRPQLRERIWQALGVFYDPTLDLDYRETGSVQMDGYAVKNICYRSRENFYVTGNFYVPDGRGPFPAVLNMHGHWAQGRLAERVQSRGHTLAKNGYVCLSVDAFGAGERSTIHGQYEYHGEMLGASLFNLGETLMGILLVDNMRAIDLLATREFVDADRLGATGASGGGNQTMWLAAMDDRVVASVPVVSVGTFEAYVGGSNCVCETLPDGLTFMEESAVLALAAPNAMKICNCLGEIYGAFFPTEMLRSYREARKVFLALGVDEKLSYQVFNQRHGYWPEIREAMLGWFDLHLRGIGHGAPKAETPFQCLPEKDLMVFPEGKRDPGVISIAEYCRKKGAALREDAEPHGDRAEKIRQLADILKTGEVLQKRLLHTHETSSDGWRRLAVETSCGRMLPLLLRDPGETRDFVLLAGSTGKDDLSDTEMFREAISSGVGIALIDLWGTGETEVLDDSCGSVYHNLSRSCLWLGKTLLGEWARDYTLTLSVLRQEFGAHQITLGGHKEAGISALFCAALSEESFSVVTEDSPRSFLFHREKPRMDPRQSYYSMALHLPGLLKWGDISLAASLAGKVRWITARRSDGERWEQES